MAVVLDWFFIGPLVIGLFVGLADWYARVVLRIWDAAAFLTLIGSSVVVAILLMMLMGYPASNVAISVTGYLLGILTATVLYLALRALAEDDLPALDSPPAASPETPTSTAVPATDEAASSR